jgi:hypothetical protein
VRKAIQVAREAQLSRQWFAHKQVPLRRLREVVRLPPDAKQPLCEPRGGQVPLPRVRKEADQGKESQGAHVHTHRRETIQVNYIVPCAN